MKLVYIVGKIGFLEGRMMFERLTQERWIGDRKRWVAFDAI
jgi:hypothetical protein